MSISDGHLLRVFVSTAIRSGHEMMAEPGIISQSMHSARPVRNPEPAERRDYTIDFKLMVVKETLMPGASVSVVSRRHDLNTNMVFRWRKEYREGRLSGKAAVEPSPPHSFIPIHLETQTNMAGALPPPAPPAGDVSTKPARGTMRLTMPGGFVLRFDASIDEAALRRVLRAVKEVR